jgi:hypothetical protein
VSSRPLRHKMAFTSHGLDSQKRKRTGEELSQVSETPMTWMLVRVVTNLEVGFVSRVRLHLAHSPNTWLSWPCAAFVERQAHTCIVTVRHGEVDRRSHEHRVFGLRHDMDMRRNMLLCCSVPNRSTGLMSASSRGGAGLKWVRELKRCRDTRTDWVNRTIRGNRKYKRVQDV